jgi:N-acetylglucosamine-6-phosphate deacetylase
VVAIPARRVLTRDGWRDGAVVHVHEGRITAIEAAAGPVPDRTVAPGFVDLQVNGIDDVDCATADGDDWQRLDAVLAAQGVTTWCPTLVTMPLDAYAAPLARIRAAMSRPVEARPCIAGAHLEGPFLGAAHGAHRSDLVTAIDLGWLAALPDHVRVVTLGPEQPLAAQATALLAARGVLVALGHTGADQARFTDAVDAGARLVTHLFNGMSGVHHRDPGVAVFAMVEPRVAASIIADGIHVHPTVLRLAFAALGHRAILVTDAVAWRRGSVGPVDLALVDGAARLPDGTLAGSALTMDVAVRTCVAAGIDLGDALLAASTRPAERIGLHDRGAIEVGRRADLVALTPELHVEQTWIGGAPAR